MARRNTSFQDLFLNSLNQAGTTAMQGGKLIGDTNRENAESKARLGLVEQQTNAAKLDYDKMVKEEMLKKALEDATGAQSQVFDGTPTADGHAVDFQQAKKANKGVKQADRALWNFLNPGSPMNDDQLATKRERDETVNALGVEDKQAKSKREADAETRAQEAHASQLKTEEAQRGLIGANTLRAKADANKPTTVDKPLKLSEAQLKTVSAAGMAKNMLDDLATQFTASKLGGASGFASDVAESVPFVGGKIAPKTAEYNDKRRIVAETFLREATGAAAPAPEVKFYTNLLPSPGDSPEQAQSKIEAFRMAVLSKTQGVVESLRLQGHDDQADMIESRLNALFADWVNIGETETQRASKAGASGSWGDKTPNAFTKPEEEDEYQEWKRKQGK